MKPILRAVLWPLRWLLALLILFEEWGWEPLHRVFQRMARWPGFRVLDSGIRRLPPWAALLVLGLPALTLLPIKLGALWLIQQGHAGWGLMLVLAAKLVGTAVVAHLFSLTQPALMRMAWFARAYLAWVTWKDALLAQVRTTWPWRAGRVVRRQWQRRWARWSTTP